MTQTFDGFMELVGSRYSCRSFSKQPVTRDMLVNLMGAARLAPSACNRQPWRFVVATEGAVLDGLRECYRKEGFKDAPVCIACIGLHEQAWHRPTDGKDHTDVDVSIAVEHLCLSAEALGLATCWVCSFEVERAAELLGLKEGEELIALLPVGYAAEGVTSPSKVRKLLEDIVTWL
ncbi:MAG: nitroreductase family protein [Candidatus Amulumruptor sp.]